LKVLAVETSTLTGSVALLEDRRLRGEVTLSVSVQHAERLLPAISRLLGDAGERLEEIGLFAVAVGPGSFTGLRVGVSAVQGLSLACGKPAVGVSSLQALALNGSYFSGTIIPLLDARRGEVYAGAYQWGVGLPKMILPDEAIAIDRLIAWTERLPPPHLFLGEGVETAREVLTGDRMENRILDSSLLATSRAANVGFLALSEDAATLPPLPRYCRPAA